MKIVVLGAGIAGETTAFFLAERGHEVTVIDRQSEAAAECSFANGGQLSYSHAEPWATPSLLKKIPKWLLSKDSPLIFHPKPDIHLAKWLSAFMGNCRQSKVDETTRNVLRLALYSREKIKRVTERTKLDFCYMQTGTLHYFNNEQSLENNIKHAAFLNELGCPSEVLNRAECLEKEPALKNSPAPLAGGVFYPLDESGDVHEFTLRLAEASQKVASNIDYRYHTTVEKIHVEQGNITSIQTDKGEFKADAFVLAFGAYSSFFLRSLKLPAPIYPMKGYSLSIPLKGGEAAPSMSLTDQGNKIVYTRLCDKVRVAGTAEFAGYNHDIRPSRIATLKRMVLKSFPQLEANILEATEWACLRPSTPDGAPLLGKTPIENLYLNTGHGTLGWTLGVGSARIVADQIEGKTPEIDLTGLTMERYL